MKKTSNTLLVFLLIVVQSALAITAGVAILFNASRQSVPTGVMVGDLSIGGMNYTNAVKAIEADYDNKFKLKSLQLKVGSEGTYEIPFSQIDVTVDGNATISSLRSINDISDVPAIFNSYFGHSKLELQPIIKFNESKLRLTLLEVSEKIYEAPTDAVIRYENGSLVKSAETNGISMNVTNAVDVIRNQLSSNPWEAVKLNSAKNFELQSVAASTNLKDFDALQQILAEYTTTIIDNELSESIRLAADSINGVILSTTPEGEYSPDFSFVDRLKTENAGFDNDNEGFDQVASTLYATLLSAGIPVDSITRLPHKLSVDYIEPGLDAWISGSAGDLKFSNPFTHKMALFAQIEGDRLKVVIAGSMSDKKEKFEIKTEIVQRFSPPVYNVENRNLKTGEKVVLNPGKEGVMVNIFRNGELIGTDKYEAEKTIIQIGPNTDWNTDEVK